MTISLSIEAAQTLLEQFTCLDPQRQYQPQDWQPVRQALQLLMQHSDYQMFGICAGSVTDAVNALSNYATAFGYQTQFDPSTIAPIEGGVYLKFNGSTQSYYASAYLEDYRGVLVSYQSSDDRGVNGTYGHFPLDLFG